MLRSVLGPLLFVIYINDLPKSCLSTEIILFADDTNITAIGCTPEAIEKDLKSIQNWLQSNKLSLNIEKTIQMNVKPSASKLRFKLNGIPIDVKPMCKYLGICVDSKLSFVSHIEYVKKRLGKQCGIISKLRHYVPRHLLMQYYKTNVQPIIQYGILVYGCCSFSSLKPILTLQKKNIEVHIFSQKG